MNLFQAYRSWFCLFVTSQRLSDENYSTKIVWFITNLLYEFVLILRNFISYEFPDFVVQQYQFEPVWTTYNRVLKLVIVFNKVANSRVPVVPWYRKRDPQTDVPFRAVLVSLFYDDNSWIYLFILSKVINVVFFGHENHFIGVAGRISARFDRGQAVLRGRVLLKHGTENGTEWKTEWNVKYAMRYIYILA